MDAATISRDVARAVDLREGPGGVVNLLRELARHEPLAVRDLSRLTGLPVPVVAATCGELRARGVVERTRPVSLTPLGRELAGPSGPAPEASAPGDPASAPLVALAVPPSLEPLRAELERLAEAAPAADPTIDQAHCTVETKLLRVAYLAETGRLSAGPILFLGDDDLISLAARLAPSPPDVVAVDVDERLVEFLRAHGVDAHAYDARDPLPDDLRGRFATVVTDPPYTLAGAELFASRAAAALADGAGDLLFSFGPKSPDETLAVERALTGMGFFTRALLRNFNEYAGAGTLGGVSHLHHLGAVAARPRIDGSFSGDLYTAGPGRRRPYRCMACGETVPVGPAEEHVTIADLKAAGCPRCGEPRFQPRPLEAR
ncbi:MAG TPA: bis-aminopropyl spermidine synthase family protein [Solirubrobacteraceae bacterium]